MKNYKTKYQKGIEFIALNDDNGSNFAYMVSEVQGYISVVLMSEVFDKNVTEIAEDVVKLRKKIRGPCQCRSCEECCPGEDI